VDVLAPRQPAVVDVPVVTAGAPARVMLYAMRTARTSFE